MEFASIKNIDDYEEKRAGWLQAAIFKAMINRQENFIATYNVRVSSEQRSIDSDRGIYLRNMTVDIASDDPNRVDRSITIIPCDNTDTVTYLPSYTRMIIVGTMGEKKDIEERANEIAYRIYSNYL